MSDTVPGTFRCAFCRMIEDQVLRPDDWDEPEENIYAFTPLAPVTPGHRLFVPFVHYGSAAQWPETTGRVFAAASRYAATQAEDSGQRTPFNLIVSSGGAATQTVPHVHAHYVPRRPGDGLMLPWTRQGH